MHVHLVNTLVHNHFDGYPYIKFCLLPNKHLNRKAIALSSIILEEDRNNYIRNQVKLLSILLYQLNIQPFVIILRLTLPKI